MKTKLAFFLYIILLFFSSISCAKKIVTEVHVKSIYASTILNSERSAKFFPHNILKPIKGKTSLPWVEGKNDEGVGEYIKISFDKKIIFNKIAILNGFNHTAWFSKNNRIKDLILVTNNKQKVIQLNDTINRQLITLDDTFTSDTIKLKIDSVYRGTDYNDTCLSQIEFYYDKMKINILSIPKYNICSIESHIETSTNCPPGGDPEIILKRDGTIIHKSMKFFGFANKGWNIKKGNYNIIMSSLEKRKFKKSCYPFNTSELWSAKAVITYEKEKSITGYIIDTGDKKMPWGFNNICSQKTYVNTHDMLDK